MTIYGYSGTAAQTHALDRAIPFVALDGGGTWMDAPDFVLPAALTVIEDEAFMNSAATVVAIPEGVTRIGARAFRDCAGLRQIYIPRSVREIGVDAFAGCDKGLLIFGWRDSPAAAWAVAQGFRFAALEE